jgi:hypothetical protein
MKPHTTSSTASTKPATMWKTCGPTIGSMHSRHGKVQASANTIVVTASQRHNRTRARANDAAVMMAR